MPEVQIQSAVAALMSAVSGNMSVTGVLPPEIGYLCCSVVLLPLWASDRGPSPPAPSPSNSPLRPNTKTPDELALVSRNLWSVRGPRSGNTSLGQSPLHPAPLGLAQAAPTKEQADNIPLQALPVFVVQAVLYKLHSHLDLTSVAYSPYLRQHPYRIRLALRRAAAVLDFPLALSSPSMVVRQRSAPPAAFLPLRFARS
eukprot:gene10003-1803_t